MNNDLILKNKAIRKNRPKVATDILYSTFETNGTFQICFKSKGCQNYLNGHCIMCDYGIGDNLSKAELEKAFDEAMLESKEKINTLLLNSYGSVLDENEISEECLHALLKKIKETNINNIIFETFYTTITKKKLELIKNELGNKNISFELGLETANENVRANNLLKFINNDIFIEKIKLIHSYNMNVLTNIVVGIPNLSPKEQIEDALNSVDWCMKNKVDEVDLFPINVKPYTLLYTLYNEKKYEVISHWLLIEVLHRIPVQYLDKIYLAWYGNRELPYHNGEHSIFPKSCPKCYNNLMKFYKEFLINNSSTFRKKLIDELINKRKCDCYDIVLKEIKT